MGDFIINTVRKFCHAICVNTFENSETSCIDSHSRQTYQPADQTLAQIELQKSIHQYCQTHKNRFWVLYYPLAEQEIKYKCWKCHSQEDKCRDYILDRVVKHIKSFDTSYESLVFSELREYMIHGIEPEVNTNLVHQYTAKINHYYAHKNIDIHRAIALLDNALQSCNTAEKDALFQIVDTYKTYQVAVKLKELCMSVFKNDETKEKEYYACIVEELILQEQFLSFIKKAIHSRFIDFTRSKAYELVVSDDIEEQMSAMEEEYDDSLLEHLNEEQMLLSKLKYGFKLDNKEFVTVIVKLNYQDIDLLKDLTSEEKFYIKLVTKYALKDDSEQLKHFDVRALQNSIHAKISKEREKLQSHSYGDCEESDQKEIYLKLLYAESMSSKEIGLIFDLTAKQIDKKIENSKKKLKSTL